MIRKQLYTAGLLLIIFLISLMLTGGCSTAESDNKEYGMQVVETCDISDNELEQMEDPSIQSSLIEEKRREDLGEFYVPLPPAHEDIEINKVLAKGLFVTGSTAGMRVDEEKVALYADYIRGINSIQPSGQNNMEEILAICLATEVNALVIDVKNDSGYITYSSDIPLAAEVQPPQNYYIQDIDRLMSLLNKYDIYPIARVVTFKDPNFAWKRPEHSIQLKSGGVYRDANGMIWVNPFDKYIWDYNIAVAREAALKGFKEIQFDYVRFPAGAASYNSITEYPGRAGRDKDEAIEQFLDYARQKLKDYHVNLAADTFGIITHNWDDSPEDIGQTWRKMGSSVDYMCPMIYPSHYGQGWYGFKVPDANPYGVVSGALKEALEKNAAMSRPVGIRPWIQGFTATWVGGHIYYGPEAIQEQIRAAHDLGIDEYLLWNAGNNYNPQVFVYDFQESVSSEDLDILGKTAGEAVQMYLKDLVNKNYPDLYLLTSIENRDDNYDVFKEHKQEQDFVIKVIGYEVGAYINRPDVFPVSLMIKTADEAEHPSADRAFKMVKENGVWKVNCGPID